MVAAAGAGVPAVEHEFFRAEPRQPRLFVKRRRALDEFVPRFARVHVHLDHAGVGRDAEFVQARIFRRRFAFDDDGQTGFVRGRFDARDEIQIIFHPFDGRHENVQPSIARLDAERGANNPRRGFARRGTAVRIFELLRALARPVAGRNRRGTAIHYLLPIRKFFRQRR